MRSSIFLIPSEEASGLTNPLSRGPKFKECMINSSPLPLLGEDHEVIKKLKGIASGELPSSPNDFTYGR
jgi:hypothetical protein